MKLTFIQPAIAKPKKRYLTTWLMEPLSIAVLSALTPSYIARDFYDDRLERIPEVLDADVIAISVETYTAQRAYQLAAIYRNAGKIVIMGGFHATLMPDEVQLHADAIICGRAESVWSDVLHDLVKKRLKKRYVAKQAIPQYAMPDRSIFKEKEYLDLMLVETGAGCYFSCDFCAVTKFYGQQYTPRPVEDIVREISSLKKKYVFFVDDNICADLARAKKLFKALIPLGIQWFSQGSINMAKDTVLLDLMVRSGCLGVLIGFESLDNDILTQMHKKINQSIDINSAVEKIQQRGIRIYGTFVFGYNDTPESIKKAYQFAVRHKLFLAAFNHLIPFPGTPLYVRLLKEHRLIHRAWWLDPTYRFGDVAFHPQRMSAEELSMTCYTYRKKFYSWPIMLHRLFQTQTNSQSLKAAGIFLFVNMLSKVDVKKRQGLPVGGMA